MDEKETDQLPDYSFYDDNVNASILRVLRNDETNEEPTTNNHQVTPSDDVRLRPSIVNGFSNRRKRPTIHPMSSSYRMTRPTVPIYS